MSNPHHVFKSSVPISVDKEGQKFVDHRMNSALRMAADLWPGSTTLVAPEVRIEAAPKGSVEYSEGAGFEIFDSNHPDAKSVLESADVLSALHSPTSADLLRLNKPVVLTTEFNLRIRLDQARTIRGWVPRTRLSLGLARDEMSQRALVKASSGVQCNGFAAWDSYAKLSQKPLAFHDHRMTASDIQRANEAPAWDGIKRLQLAFSGRLVAIKGPQFFIELANKAAQENLPADFHVFGNGGEIKILESRANQKNVKFHGFLDFDSEWKPLVRDEIDLMVLPHVQGDPSCTYFEALGSGAPVMGFENQTMSPIASKYGAGWAVKRGSIEALLAQLKAILEKPELLHTARNNGLRIMEAHTFETEAQRRMDHLLSVV